MDDFRRIALEAAQSLCRACLENLRSPVASVILHGSLATGDFVPGRSDIDLLIVVEHALADEEIEALTSVVRGADLGGAAGIDLLVATAEVCRAPAPRPALELLVGRYPGGVPDFEVDARVEESADLLPELAMARDSGRALHGAAPNEVIGVVPRTWIEERGRYWLGRWLTLADDADNAAFMVLTACRMWRFAVEGTHCSKSDAARWALAREPSLSAIERALRLREEDAREPIAEDDVTAVLSAALSEISALRPDVPPAR
ncbi:nucleotidyltransferase domain-containing protein [Actinospica durhamensis]|uniref:Nucleotidyltransferase domain-containing protein n=1 Tax=Actinospica durhamensis TaxID=1508375 RepID=A0A941EU49_9ACTN|nr:nucleotidyltransferase domain-containing protein [Actinospica durhamensis]MBR7837700.1 nucleotidyltransferase domain-containing protein [Actinospica durhamensis]